MGMTKLTPEAIYTARMWEIHKEKGTAPQSFYQNPNSKIKYNILQNKPIPTETQIYKHQKNMMQQHFGPYKNKLDNLIQPINQDLQNGVINYSIDIQQILIDLDLFFNSKQEESTSLATIRTKINNNELLEKEYLQYSQQAKELYRKLSNVDFLNSADFQKTANNLKRYFETIDYHVQTEGVGALQSLGFLSKLSYFNAVLRGRALELAAQEEIKSRLDKLKITDIQVLDTARVMEMRIGLSGAAVTGKSRTGSADAFINLQLKNAEGKVMTLDEYSDLLKKEDNKEKILSTIVDNYQGVGLQAKASAKNMVKPFSENRGTVYLSDVLSVNNKDTQSLRYLALLMKEYKALSAFYKTDVGNKNGPIYDSLFNYAIARNLHHVIGEHNALIATNNGIRYMDDYIFTSGYYIGVTRGNPVNIADAHKKLNLTMRKFK